MTLNAIWKRRTQARKPISHWKIIKYRINSKHIVADSSFSKIIDTYDDGYSLERVVVSANGERAYVAACGLHKRHTDGIVFTAWVGQIDDINCLACKLLMVELP